MLPYNVYTNKQIISIYPHVNNGCDCDYLSVWQEVDVFHLYVSWRELNLWRVPLIEGIPIQEGKIILR